MTLRLSILPGAITGAVFLMLAVMASPSVADGPCGPRCRVCGRIHSPAPPRSGVAVLPPTESPERYSLVVGGKTRITPYYPTYGAPRRGLAYIPAMSGVYYGQHGAAGDASSETNVAGYGNYAGASKNEDELLHLGGGGDGAERMNSQPDLLDLIHACN